MGISVHSAAGALLSSGEEAENDLLEVQKHQTTFSQLLYTLVLKPQLHCLCSTFHSGSLYKQEIKQEKNTIVPFNAF